ncbi:hypothetical protein PR048_029748 [Dryococelus australis]|uniref:Uncharacterized protein n=1 Tax=Dryococelus australis TaxID=614101 RepID=A0ABQ9GEI6_9NEOP|nr:hypothetical protein PR048_029748 [Dryococelus australis]
MVVPRVGNVMGIGICGIRNKVSHRGYWPSTRRLSSFYERASCATVMLPIAVVEVQDTLVQVWLDSGSHASFVLEDALSRIGMSRRKTTMPLQDLSQVPLSVERGVVSFVLKPCVKEGPCFSADMLVLPHLKLADPNSTNPDCVDMHACWCRIVSIHHNRNKT